MPSDFQTKIMIQMASDFQSIFYFQILPVLTTLVFQKDTTHPYCSPTIFIVDAEWFSTGFKTISPLFSDAVSISNPTRPATTWLTLRL
jgi:hypothetical protein